MKIIGQGFIVHKNSYLRSPWNVLDFIIVVILIFELIPFINTQSITAITAFRLLRLMRPLRSIQKIPQIRMLVVTLLRSARGFLDVAGFLAFFCSIFAILGIHQFSGA
jgi:hypothetical protein